MCFTFLCTAKFTAGPKSLKQFKMELTAVVVEQSRWRRSQLEMFITEAKMSTITADTTNAQILSLRPLKQDKMATMVSDQFGCIWGGGFNNKNFWTNSTLIIGNRLLYIGSTLVCEEEL